MSTDTHDIPVRSARDQIIDLLNIGDSYPLTDLNVVDDQLKVAYGGTAKIPIEHTQIGVNYQLCDPSGQSLGEKYQKDGTDTTLVIETPEVKEDVSYRIQATKKPHLTLPAQAAPHFLDEVAPVKVGIDTHLGITFVEQPNLALLDPTNFNPQPADPRIVVYGTSVNVQVLKTQEGVEYSLLLNNFNGQPGKTGNLGDIILSTGSMHEDVVIQVRATKTFRRDENKENETTLLDAALYLKVMANPALAVSVKSSPIIAYRQDATIMISASQQSAKYQVFLRSIADADFVRGTTDADIVTVPVEGKPTVQVQKPVQMQPWLTPEGYTALSDAFILGTGDDIEFNVKALTDDTLIIVQALKEHQVAPQASDIIASSIGLIQAAAVLVQPDPERALKLRVPVVDAKSGDSLQVSNGQPGVYYYFQPEPDGSGFPYPAYFHQRDSQDSTQNKGMNQLGIEIDFVIVDESSTATADPARTPPPLPIIDITPVATNRSLSVRAQKAQTAVDTKMIKKALIAVVPKILADPAVIDYGEPTNIVISASNILDQYQVMLSGVPVQPMLAGNSRKLTVPSKPLTADAVFEVVITRLENKGLAVERVLQVPVLVRPDTTLVVTAQPDVVPKDSATEIIVQGSQQGVSYRLMSGKTPIGLAQPGNGEDITFSSGPVTGDIQLTLVATRMDKPDIAVNLQAHVTIKIEAER